MLAWNLVGDSPGSLLMDLVAKCPADQHLFFDRKCFFLWLDPGYPTRKPNILRPNF